MATFLDERFPGDHLILDAIRSRALVGELTRAGVTGGASYDGLIAIVAAQHGATLLTLDHRAAGTYERLDTEYTLIA